MENLYYISLIINIVLVPPLIILYVGTSSYHNTVRKSNLAMFILFIWFILSLFLISKII